MVRKSFAWFDFDKLRNDSSYPSQLAAQLKHSDPANLALILNDCTDVLLARRHGIKNYNNKRKRHINAEVLSDLPKMARKIKKLCHFNLVTTWIHQPELKLTGVEPVKFGFEIDMLDLFALLTINYFDEAFAIAELNISINTEIELNSHNFRDHAQKTIQLNNLEINLLNARLHWHHLQSRKAEWDLREGTSEILSDQDKKSLKIKIQHAGKLSGLTNQKKAVDDDLLIAFIFLFLLRRKECEGLLWNSLNELAERFIDGINFSLRDWPLSANQSEDWNVSENRLKAVIKEINHLNPDVLRKFVIKPIPAINAENSRWHDFKLTSGISLNNHLGI